jgi:hypothetical protein
MSIPGQTSRRRTNCMSGATHRLAQSGYTPSDFGPLGVANITSLEATGQRATAEN